MDLAVIFLAEDGWTAGVRDLFAALAAGMEITGGGGRILFTWLILAALAVAQFRNAKSRFHHRQCAARFLTIGLLAGGVSAAQALPFARPALKPQYSLR